MPAVQRTRARAAISRRCRRRAVRDGDEYVVNGQKIWTTLAHVARYGILLARTDPDRRCARRHHVLRARHARAGYHGATARPDDRHARVQRGVLRRRARPAANIVGAEHDGWRLAKVTLGNERVSLSGEGALWGRGPTAADIVALVREHGGTTDPCAQRARGAVRRVGAAPAHPAAHRFGARARSRAGPEASVRKALADEHGQHVMMLAKELAGTTDCCDDHGPYGESDRRLALRIPLLACAHDRRWNQRGATQHPRREGVGAPERLV